LEGNAEADENAEAAEKREDIRFNLNGTLCFSLRALRPPNLCVAFAASEGLSVGVLERRRLHRFLDFLVASANTSKKYETQAHEQHSHKSSQSSRGRRRHLCLLTIGLSRFASYFKQPKLNIQP
jgi:hypothetical protein